MVIKSNEVLLLISNFGDHYKEVGDYNHIWRLAIMRMVTSFLHRRSSHPQGDLILRVMGEETIIGEVKTLEDVDITPRNLSLMSQSHQMAR